MGHARKSKWHGRGRLRRGKTGNGRRRTRRRRRRRRRKGKIRIRIRRRARERRRNARARKSVRTEKTTTGPNYSGHRRRHPHSGFLHPESPMLPSSSVAKNYFGKKEYRFHSLLSKEDKQVQLTSLKTTWMMKTSTFCPTIQL